jgi:hypothetical protein
MKVCLMLRVYTTRNENWEYVNFNYGIAYFQHRLFPGNDTTIQVNKEQNHPWQNVLEKNMDINRILQRYFPFRSTNQTSAV